MQPTRSETDARQRLLDAAERLLREQGYERMSVRAVNKAAGMNPAAVHYHFGSKEELVTALLERSLKQAWDESLTTLKIPVAPEVGEIARALVEPMARIAGDDSRRWMLALLARLVLSGQPLPWRSPWSAPEPWIAMLGRALPHLPAHAVAERWRLARDLVLLTYGAPFGDSAGPPPPTPTVIAFVAAGMAAEGATPHGHDLRARPPGAADPA
ncbi:TetR/AcrR family transcriptional regulator [Spirillospora sp. NPDC047279]|uniref:TetR/AcrR family transcriptional regulator n=1 Tax=Spirillospora sp. NPDC047279 TaxID=3155478 RepID=UPI0033DB724A